jgi:hypothetical protein
MTFYNYLALALSQGIDSEIPYRHEAHVLSSVITCYHMLLAVFAIKFHDVYSLRIILLAGISCVAFFTNLRLEELTL